MISPDAAGRAVGRVGHRDGLRRLPVVGLGRHGAEIGRATEASPGLSKTKRQCQYAVPRAISQTKQRIRRDGI